MSLNMKNKIKDFYWDHNNRKIAIGVGCASLGRTQRHDETIDHDRALLLKCYESGFRYFDTSRSYGNSELSVGAFIREIDRKTIFLATKSMLSQIGGFENFKRNFYESFQRLHTDHIDLFQIHDSDCYEICIDEVIPFLLERKKEGIISYIGMATRSLVAHGQAITDGHVDSVLSYLDYNLIKTSALPVIDLAKRYNVTFINASVLLFGLLKDNKIESDEANSCGQFSKRVKLAKEMLGLCEKMGISAIDASLQYSLLNPDVDITLNGIKSFNNLESTVNAMERPLHPEQWAAITALQRKCPNIGIMDEMLYLFNKN